MRGGQAWWVMGLWALSGCGDPEPSPDAGLPTSEFCEPPLRLCGGACVSTDNDPRHCGACNLPCPAGTFCNLGSCAAICDQGLTACGASCANLANDRQHCGDCAVPCASDRMCVSGSCVCPDGIRDCGGSCVDTRSSQAHCGGCNLPCQADEVCSDYRCVCARATRETACNDTKDDDCDELIDCADPDCNGATRACSGVCGAGVETCQAGSFGACSGGDGSSEVCGDGIDQDCDGSDLRNPDVYEPNDDCGQCVWLQSEPDPQLSISASFDSVDDAEDCYAFDGDDGVAYRELIQLQLDQIPAGHDYDLYLYASQQACNDRVPLASSAAFDNTPETIEWGEAFGSSESATYYIRVVRFSGNSCTDQYRLDIDGLR